MGKKEATEQQTKSRERVAKHGEVFTAAREVNAMLDLVKEETERIESRFLEPACGTGNFLAEILRRKLDACGKYLKSPLEWEKNSVLACSSLYGIELLADNAEECRGRLFGIWQERYGVFVGAEGHPETPAAVRFLFGRNILCGDALSLKQADGTPILFSEWALATGTKMKRRDFRLDVLLEKGEEGAKAQLEFDFFGGESPNAAVHWMPDPEDGKRMIPAPVREYPLTDYWRIHEC